MGAAHDRHRRPTRKKPSTGMLSRRRMGCQHLGQVDPGQRMLFSNGSRATQTLRKLPNAAPTRKTKTNQNTRNAMNAVPGQGGTRDAGQRGYVIQDGAEE